MPSLPVRAEGTLANLPLVRSTWAKHGKVAVAAGVITAGVMLVSLGWVSAPCSQPCEFRVSSRSVRSSSVQTEEPDTGSLITLNSQSRVRFLEREPRSQLKPASYISFLTALAAAPVSRVAPLRETRILIGALLGTRFLAEGKTKLRLAAAGAITAGVMLVALA